MLLVQPAEWLWMPRYALTVPSRARLKKPSCSRIVHVSASATGYKFAPSPILRHRLGFATLQMVVEAHATLPTGTASNANRRAADLAAAQSSSSSSRSNGLFIDGRCRDNRLAVIKSSYGL